MAVSFATVSGQLGPTREPNGRLGEWVTVTGSTGVAGDSNTFVTKFLQRPDRVEDSSLQGAFSGTTVTLTASEAYGDRTGTFKITGLY